VAQVVQARGAGSLTLEAVADVAGVSKGGLLYHFPTKDALIDGMVADALARSAAPHLTRRCERVCSNRCCE
jgi:AcrR family transcriptional regulator